MNKKDNSINRVHRHRQRGRSIPRVQCADIKRRKKLETNSPEWLKYYLAEAFYKPFGKVHYDLISDCDYAIANDGYFSFACPRGTGKTSISQGMTLKANLAHGSIFPVVIPATGKSAKKILSTWKKWLCFNPRLAEDYPEICAPFVHSRGSGQKIKSLLWEDTGEAIGAELRLSDGMIVLPNNRGVFGSASITGEIRGIFHTCDDGTILRPTLILLDDPQTKESAKSSQQVRDRIDIIKGDVLGCAGPGKKLTVFMPGTVIKKDDVMDQFLDNNKNPDWRGKKVKQFIKFPENMDLWNKYNDIRLNGLDKKDNGKAANDFYKNNRKELDAGAIVSWEERYDNEKELSAIQSGMNDYYKMGEESFAAERQNEPLDPYADSQLYNLTADIIRSRVNGIERFKYPDDAHTVIASTDINHYGMHWCSIGFANDFTGWCSTYGCFPDKDLLVSKKATQKQIDQAVFNGLVYIGDKLAELPRPPDVWIIDRGYCARTVHRFVQSARYPFRVACARGFAGHHYRINRSRIIGPPREECHFTSSDMGRWIAFNSDYWRMTAQRAWLSEQGSPGSLSLYGNNTLVHRAFAEQVCAEKLVDVAEGSKGIMYKWANSPGAIHDWGDAVYLAYIGAAILGLTTGGVRVKKEENKNIKQPSTNCQPKPKRKIGVIKI